MKNRSMTFSNKLELRYHFNEKNNYLDAMIRHRCEKEILTMIRSLSDMLDVKLTVYSEPAAITGRFGPSPARIRVAYRLS